MYGILYVVSGPSGAGKTSIINKVLNGNSGMSFSVSCTTREKREGETEGKDYMATARQVVEAIENLRP